MFTSIIIPTYNRRKLWERGLLLQSICQQTVPIGEVLICDDNSTDATADVLPSLLADLPCPVRLFRTTVPKRAVRQASALPDNVLFAQARPDSLLVHLDDDGWVERDYVSRVLALADHPGIYYSRIKFYNPDNLELLYDDTRLKHVAPTGMTRIDTTHTWGAAYICPAATVREIGGHNMEVTHMMGSDSRFGFRLSHRLPAYFCADLTFHHLGPSYIQALRLTGRTNEIDQNRLTPVRHKHYQPDIVANGGLSFWEHGMDGMFELVWKKS